MNFIAVIQLDDIRIDDPSILINICLFEFEYQKKNTCDIR